MQLSDPDLALRWLAGAHITPLGPDRWLDTEPPGVTEMSNDDVAWACAYEMVYDDDSDPVQRVQTALGLLDLTGALGVLVHLNAYVIDHDDPAVIEAFWAGCRARLEAADPIANLRLSLRTDWFIGNTSEAAFAALLGDDVRRPAADDRLPDLAQGPLHRRACHVLEDSGTVRWIHKHDVLRAAATVVELHQAVFEAPRPTADGLEPRREEPLRQSRSVEHLARATSAPAKLSYPSFSVLRVDRRRGRAGHGRLEWSAAVERRRRS